MPEILPTETRELKLQKSGATREASYKAIVSGLSATKMTVDKFGIEHWEDDHTSRLRAAELVARLNGDLKTETVIDNRQITITASQADVATLLAVVSDVKLQIENLKRDGHQTGEIIDIAYKHTG